MTSFASALVACIGVIAAGYGAGRLKIIDTAGAGPAAIGAFVGRFALPALLFPVSYTHLTLPTILLV